MKAFIVLVALVAAVYAEAEADPALLYGNGLYAPYALGVGLKSAPCVNAANIPVPCAGYNGYAAYAPYGLLGRKRREAEADPALLLGAGYPYAYGLGLGLPLVHPSRLGVCLNNVGQQVPC